MSTPFAWVTPRGCFVAFPPHRNLAAECHLRPVAPLRQDPPPRRALLAAPRTTEADRVRELVGQGWGRPRIARELGISTDRARKLIDAVKAGEDT